MIAKMILLVWCFVCVAMTARTTEANCDLNCSTGMKTNTSTTQRLEVTNVGFSDLVFSSNHACSKNISTCTISPDSQSQITNVIMPDANCVDGKSNVKLSISLCVPKTGENNVISRALRQRREVVQLFSPIDSLSVGNVCEIPANSVSLTVSPNCSSPSLPWQKTLMVNDTACLIKRGDQDCSQLKLSTASWCDPSIGVCRLCNSPFVTGCKIGSCAGGTCTECDDKFYQQRKEDELSGKLLGCFSSCPSTLYEDLTNDPSRPGLWCISKCPANSYNTTRESTKFSRRTRKLAMTIINECKSCDEMCEGCYGFGPSQCTKCKHVNSTDGVCVSECLAYEYEKNGVCEKISELIVLSSHLYVVGTVSTIVCGITCLLYCKNKWHLQRHPGPLVMNKMLYEMTLCMVLIAQSISDSMPGQQDLCHGVFSRRFSSWVLQFSLLGSELTYLALCYDLRANLMNPFREVKSATRNIRLLILVVSLATGAFVMILTEQGVVSVSTIASFGEICWLDPKNQLAYLFLLYIPLGGIYTMGIYFTAISAVSLRGALPKAQRVWSAVFRQQSVYILGFSAYWIMFGLLILLQPIVEKRYGEQGKIFVSFLLNFFLGARGTLTVLLWVRVVYRDDTLMHTNLVRSKSLARAIARTLSFGGDDATRDFPKGGSVSSGLENNNNANTSLPFLSGGATTEDEDRKQDLNLQPHLNVALRQELLYFTRLGILHSIRKFRKLEHSKDHELQQRSHSSRYLLRRDVPANFTFDGMSPTNTMSTKLMRPSPSPGKHGRKEGGKSSVLSWLGSSFPFSFGGDDELADALSEDDGEEEEEDVLKEEDEDEKITSSCWCTRKRQATFPIVFTDYFRHTFDDLRRALNISKRSYMRSMKSITSEHFSEGKSGSFFFFSGDKRYMVKSITIEEFRCLSRILPAMNTYLTSDSGRKSFLARLLGCHSITIYSKQIYFVVMTNSLYSGSDRNALKIHERYDLKGAWDNRNVRPLEPGTRAKCIHCNLPFVVGDTRALNGRAMQCPERPTGRDHEPSRLFLDNDLNRKVTLQVDLANRVKAQLTRDSAFLESQGLLDYSMLLGVHRRRCLLTNESLLMVPRSAVKAEFRRRSWNKNATTTTTTNHHADNLESKEKDDENETVSLPTIPVVKHNTISMSTPVQTLRGSNIRRSRHCRFGEQTLQAAWVEGPALYWISIIDFLQEWTWKKRTERVLKMIFRCKRSDGFCAVPPEEYGERFRLRIVDGAFESANVGSVSSSASRSSSGEMPLHHDILDEKKHDDDENKE